MKNIVLALALSVAVSLDAGHNSLARLALVVKRAARPEITSAFEIYEREYQKAMSLAVKIRESFERRHKLKLSSGGNILAEAERLNFAGLSEKFHHRALPELEATLDALAVIIQDSKIEGFSLKDEKNAALKDLYGQISAPEDSK